MTYREDIQATREHITQCERNVKVQRERLVQLRERESDTWLVKRLLMASENTLLSNRERLRNLLVR